MAIEIKSAFKGPWRELIVLIPLLSAITAGILVAGSGEPTFQATGVLSISEFGQAENPAAVRSLTDDLEATLDSVTVKEVVRELAPSTTGLISSESLGQGGGVEVALEGDDADEVFDGLDAGIRRALSIMSEVERRQMDRQLIAADREAAASIESLQEIERNAGAASLEQEAQRRSADLLALRNQIAAAANEPSIQAALRVIQAEKQTELEAIEAQLLDWTNVRARYDVAVRSGADASLRLRQISTVQDDLDNENILQSVRVVESSTVPDVARATIAAAVLAAVLVISLALLFGGRATSRRLRRAREQAVVVAEGNYPDEYDGYDDYDDDYDAYGAADDATGRSGQVYDEDEYDDAGQIDATDEEADDGSADDDRADDDRDDDDRDDDDRDDDDRDDDDRYATAQRSRGSGRSSSRRSTSGSRTGRNGAD